MLSDVKSTWHANLLEISLQYQTQIRNEVLNLWIHYANVLIDETSSSNTIPNEMQCNLAIWDARAEKNITLHYPNINYTHQFVSNHCCYILSVYSQTNRVVPKRCVNVSWLQQHNLSCQRLWYVTIGVGFFFKSWITVGMNVHCVFWGHLVSPNPFCVTLSLAIPHWGFFWRICCYR